MDIVLIHLELCFLKTERQIMPIVYREQLKALAKIRDKLEQDRDSNPNSRFEKSTAAGFILILDIKLPIFFRLDFRDIQISEISSELFSLKRSTSPSSKSLDRSDPAFDVLPK